MGAFVGTAVACVLGLLGLGHILYPARAWRIYRPRFYPDETARFHLRLLGVALIALGGLVGTVVYLFF